MLASIALYGCEQYQLLLQLGTTVCLYPSLTKTVCRTIILFTFAGVFKFICQYCSSVPRFRAYWSRSILSITVIQYKWFYHCPDYLMPVDCVFRYYIQRMFAYLARIAPLLVWSMSYLFNVLSFRWFSFICSVLGTITTLLLRRVVCPSVSPFHPVFVTPLLYSVTLTFCLD